MSVNLSNPKLLLNLLLIAVRIEAAHLLRTVKIFLIEGFGVFHVKVKIFAERVNPQVVRKTHKFQICMFRQGVLKPEGLQAKPIRELASKIQIKSFSV